jgi:hypothetical protein
MNTIRHRTVRRAALAMVGAVILAAPLTVQVVAATPASAVDGLRRVLTNSGQSSSFLWREAIAGCDNNEVVVGGGAEIIGGGNQVRLTMMFPLSRRFLARAEEPDTGYTGNWRLETYAICANTITVQGYEMAPPQRSGESSSVFKHQTAGCPGNKKVIGTGAQIFHANGQVGLQLARPAGPLDIARATAREDADGYAQDWELVTHAICANRIASAAVYGTLGDSGGSASCPPDKYAYSVGGGGSLTDSGPYCLRTLRPSPDLRGFSVWMTGPPVDQTAIGAICAFVL